MVKKYLRATAGQTNLYATVSHNLSGVLQFWNTVTPALENYNSANWANYDFALTEEAPGWYSFTIPSGLAAGFHFIGVYAQLGATPAITDTVLPGSDLVWSGLIELDAYNLQSRLPTALVSGKMDSVAAFSGTADANVVTWLGHPAQIDGGTPQLPIVSPTNISGGGGGTVNANVVSWAVSGLIDVNVFNWAGQPALLDGGTPPLPAMSANHYAGNPIHFNVAGYPIMDVGYWLGTPPLAPSTPGVPVVEGVDVYYADIDLTVDTAQDEYTVQWFKNGNPITTGVTAQQLQIIRRADGSNLLPPTNMTQVGSGICILNTTSARQISGEAIVVQATAIIDGNPRTWRRVVSRDMAVATGP